MKTSKVTTKTIIAILLAVSAIAAIAVFVPRDDIGKSAKKVVAKIAAAVNSEHVGHGGTPGDAGKSGTAQHKDIYRCPMHPFYTSDKPGNCPICGMTLVKDAETTAPETPPSTPEEPMQDMPKGLSMVALSGEKIQLIGIRTVATRKGDMVRSVRATAYVAMDERRVKQVQSKTAGWIEKLYVNYVGQYVKRGQALMEIYSPDLVGAQEEYLIALRNLNSLQGAEQSIRDGAQELLDATRKRLKYWDISNAQIKRLEQNGKPMRTITFYSPAGGYVIETKPTQGMQVTPGMPLFTIADLSRVWILVGVFERDMAFVKKGMEVVFQADAYPDRKFNGHVSYINPQLDRATRTATVRVEMPNPDMVLRPEMYGYAILIKHTSNALIVPSGAVMNSGETKVVYVQTEPGHFMPREVKVGIQTNDESQILEGLDEGEEVVVEGNFMLDSESRLRAATKSVGSGGGMDGMKH